MDSEEPSAEDLQRELEQVRTASPSVKESPQARYGLLRTVLVVCGFLALLFLSAWHVAGLRP